MPLETATYISELNASNPAHSDPINQDDAHMRLVKSTIKATFPNFAGAAVTATEAELSTLASGVTKLADAGAYFATDTDTGIASEGDGVLGIIVNGDERLIVTEGEISGANNAQFIGPGITPIGGSIIWWSDTLPDSTYAGVWHWLNGQELSRATYPVLFNIFGTTYGVGDGSTTFNVPDLRDNVPVGKATMGGVSDVDRIGNADSTSLGNSFGEDEHQLTWSEMPDHNHTGTTGGQSADHHHSYDRGGTSGLSATAGGGTPLSTNVSTSTGGTSNDHVHGFTTDGAGDDDSHNNIQPSIVCNWIVRAL